MIQTDDLQGKILVDVLMADLVENQEIERFVEKMRNQCVKDIWNISSQKPNVSKDIVTYYLIKNIWRKKEERMLIAIDHGNK